MAKVTIDVPGTPKEGEGSEVVVPGLGRFKNGTTTDVEKEQVQAWEGFSNMKWPSSGELKLPIPADPAKTKTPAPQDPPEQAVAPAPPADDE